MKNLTIKQIQTKDAETFFHMTAEEWCDLMQRTITGRTSAQNIVLRYILKELSFRLNPAKKVIKIRSNMLWWRTYYGECCWLHVTWYNNWIIRLRSDLMAEPSVSALRNRENYLGRFELSFLYTEFSDFLPGVDHDSDSEMNCLLLSELAAWLGARSHGKHLSIRRINSKEYPMPYSYAWSSQGRNCIEAMEKIRSKRSSGSTHENG